MFQLRSTALFALTALGLAAVQVSAAQVSIDDHDGHATLSIDGQPFPIKGAGGTTHFDRLAAAGGNAVRTWGVDEGTRELLDRAHENGLKVAVGIWLGHARHGFDYGDPAQVQKQLDDARAAVEKYKDHPAVLLWGVGNEMEEYGQTTDPRVWKAVNDVAAMIAEVDPHHPTMTVIAEIGGDKLASIDRFCPDVDIVGINTYGGVSSIPQRYAQAGLDKPYIVTEFGPAGTWEVGRNSWNVPEELTSTAKADVYANAYAALDADPHCLGSFAFLWGNKQEATATWFGMLLPDGTKLGAVDAMTRAWSGHAADNLTPQIQSLSIDGSPIVEPGGKIDAQLEVRDPEGDALQTEWQLFQEMEAFESAGDYRPTPPTFPDAIQQSDTKQATVRMPEQPGNYRLFAYVRDGQGGGAVANVPLRVQGATNQAAGQKIRLPLKVYDEAGLTTPYIPSGYMGNAGAINIQEDSREDPASGGTCLKITYAAPDAWGGVVWQHPANDWGDQDGGYDLSRAEVLHFKVRGSRGGERIKFGMGLIGREKPYFDTGKTEREIVLTDQWQTVELPLDGKDLSRIKSGFYWSLAGHGQPVTFYLDEIIYRPAQDAQERGEPD